MTKLLALIVLLVVYPSLSPSFAETPKLTITEVFADPKAVGDSDGEWFEIYNPTDQAISLKNLVMKDDGRDGHSIDSDVGIGPKSYLVFCKNKSIEQNGGVTCAYQYSKFSLANESDEIILEKDGEIARLVYSKSSHPVKSGKSMELDGSSWHEATSQFGKGDYGTPGSGNSAAPTLTSVPQPTETPSPKPTKTPVPTIKLTEASKIETKVLAAEETNEEQAANELIVNAKQTNSQVITDQPISPTSEIKERGVGKFFMWGGVLSMMGAIGSFLWISNRGTNS